jgi:hypothetical protein
LVNPELSGSPVILSLDLWSAKVLVWMAARGQDVELTPDAHRFFFDRYSRLAEHHRTHGHIARARRLQDKADEHYCASDDDGPFAAAMAMPRPRTFVTVNAVGRRASSDSPTDAA